MRWSSGTLVLACSAMMLGSPVAAQQSAQADMFATTPYDATPHLRVTPTHPATAADSARGDSLVRVARRAISRYESVDVAEQDGYRIRVEKMKQAKVLHYTNVRNALRARFEFDPALPTSLLYQRAAGGQLQLIGVMYTVPGTASLDELNARVPLSLVQWHQHINVCLPADGSERRAADHVGKNARFGPRGSIVTEEACEQAGGRFKAQSFGWMVHVNVMSDAPWAAGQAHMHMGMEMD